MNDATKAAVWQETLDADYNVRYWTILAQHFKDWEKYSHIVLAVFTSGAVVGWISGFAHTLNFSISSAASVIATVVLPKLKWGDIATQSLSERRAWEGILADWKGLSLELENGAQEDEVLKSLDKFRKKCAKQAGGKNVLPRIASLEQKARKQVCTFYNIPDTAPEGR
jgi:hypothetical protein